MCFVSGCLLLSVHGSALPVPGVFLRAPSDQNETYNNTSKNNHITILNITNQLNTQILRKPTEANTINNINTKCMGTNTQITKQHNESTYVHKH